jgi:hypothetical protein
MDAKLKEAWVKALRSGDYRQANGKLFDPAAGSYCCLGVLCKVAGAEFKVAEIVLECDEGSYMSTLNNAPVLNGKPLVSDDNEELSEAYCKEIGIPDQRELIGLNDGEGKPSDKNYKAPQPFDVIADYIEANL